MKIIAICLVFIGLLACAKHTTPRKVERKLGEGSWLMTEFIEGGKSILKKYKDVSFSFSEEGSVVTTSANSVKGSWYLGENRNPAVLYLTFPETDSMHAISDDWIVYSINKTECVLKRYQGTTGGVDAFDYDASLDRLTLSKK